MKTVIQLIIVLSLILSATTTSAQQTKIKRSNNKVSLNGKPYYIHIVHKGETLYAIGKAYNVSIDTIKIDNLHITDNVKINQYIKIRISQHDGEKQKFVYHNVKKGDTPFNLALKYNISIDKIYEHNPNAKLGIAIGEILKIPVIANTATIAEEKKDSTIIKKEKPSFILYKVQKKETKFGIAAQHNTTVEKIEDLNPHLKKEELQVNEKIKIPVNKKFIENDNKYYYHKVLKQETISGLARQYKIKEKHLYKYNPDLKKRMLQEGELIKIIKNEISDSIFVKKAFIDTCKHELERDVFSIWKDTLILPSCPIKQIDTITKYKVAFFLPFYLNINDTLGKYINVMVKEDGVEILETVLRTGRIKDNIHPKSKIFIDFYQGALLALLNLKEQGISFDTYIFDTQNDSTHVSQLLKDNDLSGFDLFIGPIYGNNLQIIGDFAWEHQINIVSPLSLKNEFIEHNPYAFQVSPPFEVQMQHASDFLNEFDVKNYIVIHDGNNLDQNYISHFKQQLFAQMNQDNFNQIKYNEVFYYDARDSILKEVFTPGMKNIVIVPSNNQAFVTDVMGKLNGYSYEYDITIFGQPRWLRFENIELDNFHNTNTHIFSNSFINYTKPGVINFVKNYRLHFVDEPNKYAFQGYDITKYFCLALNKYGKDFRKCIHIHHIDLLQTSFQFVPYTDQGGFQNTAIYILEYSKDYKLRKVAQFP